MSKHRKSSTLLDKLRGYYEKAEKDAACVVPFYVTGDGVMFTDPKEVIRSKNVRQQFVEFELLRDKTLKAKEDDAEAFSPS